MQNSAENALTAIHDTLTAAASKARETVAPGVILDQIGKLLQNSHIFPEKTPAHVYHYTNITGLTGILLNHQLWATDLLYMNDTSEFVYADSLISESLLKLMNDADLSKDLASVLHTEPMRAHAACFCEEENLLSQWRTYAMAGGTGYALEFEWRADARPVGFWAASGVLSGRVAYDKERQQEVFQLLSDSLLKPFIQGRWMRLLSEGCSVEDLAEEMRRSYFEPFWAWQLTQTIARCFMKNSVFKEEKEWRLVELRLASGDPISEEFEPSKGILVPHLTIDLKEASMPKIKRIFVGPSPHPDLAHRSLERFLKKHQLEHIGIESKPIPLRLWP